MSESRRGAFSRGRSDSACAFGGNERAVSSLSYSIDGQMRHALTRTRGHQMISAARSRTGGRGWSIVRRMPLSIVFIVGTTMIAIATGALNGGTPASTIARFGYSLDHLRAGRLYVVPTSDWL